MVKTRSQTSNIEIKKEEEDHKDAQLLHSVNSTIKKQNKITKRKTSKSASRFVPAQEVKVEQDTDTMPLLKALSEYSKLPKGQIFSQEQINQLIDNIVNHNMSIREASGKAKIPPSTARDYYNEYKNDPEKNIPAPLNRYMRHLTLYTQEHIENLIRYIVDEKLSIKKASAKAKMTYRTGIKYYKKYLQDPYHNIPIPFSRPIYTQDQKNEFISFIVNDKMNIKTASKKANIGYWSGKKYFHEHFNNQTRDISTSSRPQEDINKFISYVNEGKMSVRDASKKANMDPEIGKRYYQQHLNGLNQGIPAHIASHRPFTQEQLNTLIRYIVDDKMTVAAASRKSNMTISTGLKYYHRYIEDPNNDAPTHIKKPIPCTQEQVTDLIRYIVEDKMCITKASRKASMSQHSGRKYYNQYLQNHPSAGK